MTKLLLPAAVFLAAVSTPTVGVPGDGSACARGSDRDFKRCVMDCLSRYGDEYDEEECRYRCS